jgi:glycosyltransferase involved in cell wall biosynthesis
MKKLLIIGSNTIHVYNYIELVRDFFDEIILITDEKRAGTSVKTEVLDFRLNPISGYKTIRKIKDIILEFNPSIIHIHQANSYAFLTLNAAKKFNIPKILTAWGSDILVLPKTNWLLKKMVQYNLRNASAFTSDSIYMAAEMQRLVPEKKLNIRIANFGIEIIDLQIPKENIIYSNRLHKKNYRIDRVIEGFKKFIDNTEDQSWKLVIAGTGEETEALISLTEKLNLKSNVEFVGWVDKLKNAEYYTKAKLFISIPQSDATAISLLEAMAYGCIPVLSDLPANNEWIKNGENGIIVNSLDDNFFERAFKLNIAEVASLNKMIVEEKGTKLANKNVFTQLYDSLLKKSK